MRGGTTRRNWYSFALRDLVRDDVDAVVRNQQHVHGEDLEIKTCGRTRERRTHFEGQGIVAENARVLTNQVARR